MKSFYIILLAFTLAACAPHSIQGPRGDDGAPGAPGHDGVDATPMTIVQLCPSVIGGHGNFPEKAIKIGTKLYGVYSASNQAALVELYPGAYATTTPNGTNCSFIVNADGSVSH